MCRGPVRNNTQYLFVYGTLCEDADHEMYRVLARSAHFVADGEVRARLFDLGSYPGIVLSSAAEDRVAGEVYELDQEVAENVLRVLDDYEGLGPSDNALHEYQRLIVKVTLRDGRELHAWAYVLAEAEPRHPRIASGDYLAWKKRLRGA